MSGTEWLVEAYGCPPAALADLPTLATLLDRIVADLGLTPVGDPRWHQFPTPGGITGLVLLAESHLTVHTWPEHGSLCLNLFCCTPRPTWDFAAGLAELVGATEVAVRVVERSFGRRVSGCRGVRVSGVLGNGGQNVAPVGAAVVAARLEPYRDPHGGDEEGVGTAGFHSTVAVPDTRHPDTLTPAVNS